MGNDSKPSPLPPFLAAASMVLLLLSGYAVAYLWAPTVYVETSERYDRSIGGFVSTTRFVREFRSRWLAIAFVPAARIEGLIRNHEVQLEPAPATKTPPLELVQPDFGTVNYEAIEEEQPTLGAP